MSMLADGRDTDGGQAGEADGLAPPQQVETHEDRKRPCRSKPQSSQGAPGFEGSKGNANASKREDQKLTNESEAKESSDQDLLKASGSPSAGITYSPPTTAWIARSAKMLERPVAVEQPKTGMVGSFLHRFQTVTLKWNKFLDYLQKSRDEAGMNPLDRFVRGEIFSVISNLVIFFNTAYLGYEADLNVRNEYARMQGQAMTSTGDWIQYVFIAFFVLELLLKLVVDRAVFFIGRDCVWNLFDTFLVVTSVFESLFDSGINVSFGRIFRMFRLVRVIRVVRAVKVLKDFRTMLLSIVRSFMALVWAFVILALVQYIFAMLFVNGVTSHMATKTKMDAKLDALYYYYGSLPKALCRLFEGISGADWVPYARVLNDISGIYYAVWVTYVFIMLLGILNVVTGVVVDASVQQATKDRKEMVEEELQRQRDAMKNLRQVFLMADEDKSGHLSWANFGKHLGDDYTQLLLATMDVTVTDLTELFHILDVNEDNAVSIDEFVGGCMHLKGYARSLDLCSFIIQQREQYKQLAMFMTDTSTQICELRAVQEACNVHDRYLHTDL